jgi:hypothetical protein
MKLFYKSFLLFMSLASFIVAKAQTTLYSEDFNGSTNSWSLNTTDASSSAGPNSASGLKNYWIVNNDYTGGAGTLPCTVIGFPAPINYSWTNTPTQPAAIAGNPSSNYLHITTVDSPMNAGYFAPDQFSCVVAANHFARMTSDISTTGYSSVTVKFWWMGSGASNSYVQFFYSTNSGSTWTQVNMATAAYFAQQTTWREETITLPEFANNATFRIGIRLANNGGTNFPVEEVGYAFDDFRIIGEGGTVVNNEITTSALPATVCQGATISVPFTAVGTYTAGNIFTAQLSNATGSFAAPVNIGTLNSTTSGTINATIPGGTAMGSGYRIRVISSAPATTGTDNGTNIAVSTSMTWYADADGDGHGNINSTVQACAQPAGYVSSNNDCDDTDALVWLAKPVTISLDINPAQICVTAAPVALSGANPTGGTWSGTGVTNGMFNPATAGVGTQTVSYFVAGDGACNLPATSSANITVLAANDCGTIGIEELEGNGVTLYPTQTRGQIFFSGIDIVDAVIMDMGGKVVRTISLLNDKTANVSDLASGIYLVKVNTKTSANVFKIVKED